MRVDWPRIARRIRVPCGFAFAALYLWLAQPTRFSIGLSLLLVVPGLLLRAYASGYVRKNAELATTGPYAYTRNPLYLGSMLLAFGFAGASRSPTVVLALAGLFALIYVPTIRSEEAYLRAHFPAFAAYAMRVPRLLPRRLPGFAPRDQVTEPGAFSRELFRKHREYNAPIGAGAVYAALLLRLYFHR